MAVTTVPDSTSEDGVQLATPRRTRIDAPHEAARPELEAAPVSAADPVAADHELLEVIEEPSDDLVSAVSGESLDIRREQLQLQVSQLAAHLRDRLREVDRREGQLHARAAQVETELRSNRLWLSERENEAQAREGELRRRIEELEERLSGGAGGAGAAATQTHEPSGDLSDREQQLSLREAELRERRHEDDRRAAALSHAQKLWQQDRRHQEHELAEQRTDLTREFQTLVAEREEQLQRAERLVEQQAQQLAKDQAALLAERREWDQHKSRQRQALEERQQAADAELAERRQRLEARQEWLERQKSGLDQVRGEILALHRQSLEMRLLAEQLWSQITARLSPAEITQSIAQLRLKLAEQYKLEEQGLAARREELLQLSERVTQQHGELTQLRGGLREWAAAREAEIEQQASALVHREHALDEQEQDHRRAAASWTAERLRYEEQLRDLSAQLRAQPAAA